MRKEYHFWTYIVTNYEKTVMYTGMTNDIRQRLKEHYDNRGDDKSFAGRYYCYNLVYFEYTKYANNAIGREKEIKDMSRERKMNMISLFNPGWQFLNIEICGSWPPAFEGRLLKEIEVDDNINEDEWWVGLTPPPVGE